MRRNILVDIGAASAAAMIVIGYATVGNSAEASGEWKAPPPAADRKNPIPAGAGALAAGKAAYNRTCVSCHGNGGKGDGKDGRDLEPAPADLSAPDVTGQSDGALFWKITTGRKPMPSFRKDLSDEERWQVIQYIRALAANGGRQGKP